MSINDIVMLIIVALLILGGIDYILGDRFKLGTQFEEGIMAMGSLALSMAGIIVIAPVLADVLRPVIVPVFEIVGADPGMFAGSLLAIDMGAVPLAENLAVDPTLGDFSSIIVGSMLGATIVFSIPVSLGIIDESDQEYLATGILCGIGSIPFGSFVGGVMMGISPLVVLQNLIPIIILAAIIMAGLILFTRMTIKIFIIFGKIVSALATIGLVLGGIELLLGITTIPGLASINDAFLTVGVIAVTLAGAYGLVYVITKVFRTPLLKIGELIGINETAAAGLIASLANNIAMFQTMNKMNIKGKVLNVAFAVSASFAFGDHLGFVAGLAPDLITPVIVGKLVGGAVGLGIAYVVCDRIYGDRYASETTPDEEIEAEEVLDTKI